MESKNNIIGYIHSKETFGTVDGPGVRYVLFLQGCPLRCKYCHNPDTWAYKGGEPIMAKEVIEDYKKYEAFLKGGGITLSGGEPLLQIDFVIELFKECKKEGIHTTIDTSGALFNKNNPKILSKYKELIQYVDLFLLDFKHIDDREHISLTGLSNKKIKDFLEFLDENNKDVWIRHVIIPTITFNKKYLFELGYFLGYYNNIKIIDVLPYHTMGVYKYKNMGKIYPLEGIKALRDEDALLAKKIILLGIKKRREDENITQ